ncbi:MAG TPA: DUF5996 family protein, partial [Candidatus Acidoferrales bacterium]|nr:DUF5996 family protein [Candidatus Acidoferrales bacterium]
MTPEPKPAARITPKYAPDLFWPALPLKEWEATRATLHMWTQMAGKVRLALTPLVNHWWNTTLYVNSRGLSTSAIPYGKGDFEIQFDFLQHILEIQTCDGQLREIELKPRSVADFYREFMQALASLGIRVKIWPMPMEIPNPIRFDQDTVHASYDPDYANRFWRALVSADAVLQEFRARFIGKVSPVHFFWGSFDLAVTRFSGHRAPERPGADLITREAYSHEVSSAGFWPGNEGVIDAAFYAYAAPEPPGFKQASVQPAAAYYGAQQSEFFLPYEDVRKSDSPRDALLDFCESTYDATASLGNWDRAALERPA